MNRLKELREDNDIYQKDIAKYLNVDQSNYSKYELEKINIPVIILIDYLLYRTDVKDALPKSIVKEDKEK